MKLKTDIRRFAHSHKLTPFNQSNLHFRLKTNNKHLELVLNEILIYKR